MNNNNEHKFMYKRFSERYKEVLQKYETNKELLEQFKAYKPRSKEEIIDEFERDLWIVETYSKAKRLYEKNDTKNLVNLLLLAFLIMSS